MAAVVLVMAALGVSGPQGAPPGWEKKILLVNHDVTFTQGFTSGLNICFAYAGEFALVYTFYSPLDKTIAAEVS